MSFLNWESVSGGNIPCRCFRCRRARLLVDVLIVLSLLVFIFALASKLKAQTNPPFNWVNIGGTYRIAWNYPFQVSQSLNDNGVFAPTAACDGVTDDTAAIQTSLNAAGSFLAPPTITFLTQTHNLAQGVARLPAGPRTCVITSALTVPPGVSFDLNGSTLKQTTNAADAVVIPFSYNNSLYGYGVYFNEVYNGFITGPGNASSTGHGFLGKKTTAAWVHDLTIQQFKIGFGCWECQYVVRQNVRTDSNQVGTYWTADPADHTLTAIDDVDINDQDAFNTKYGLWCQTCAAMQFAKGDLGRNGEADLVIGSQLSGWLKTNGYTVNSGGSGCGAFATDAVSFSGGGGSQAQAYATTNSSGNVISITGIDGGTGYTTQPSITVPACTVQPSVTATIGNDAGLGDWDGVSATNRGELTFQDMKVEHATADRPNTGYDVVIDGSHRMINFDKAHFMRGGDYHRWIRNAAFGVGVTTPNDSSSVPSDVSCPAGCGQSPDVSVIRSTVSQGLYLLWPIFNGQADIFKYVIDETGTTPYGGFRQASLGWTQDGKPLSTGWIAYCGASGVPGFQSYVPSTSTTNPFWSVNCDGTISWGPGTGATDTSLSRSLAQAVGGAGVIPLVKTVAALPSASTYSGAIYTVSDSTAIASEGQTCAGGGATKALAFSNGAAWKCF